jgi:hypothetical protein
MGQILGFLVNENGSEYCTVYLKGTIDDYSDFNQGDIFNQETEMTNDEFEKLVQNGWARKVKFENRT